MFKVGDSVRVKAGSPAVLWRYGIKQIPKGQKLTIESVHEPHTSCQVPTVHLVEGDWVAEEKYIEPWNDAEEWDGSKWVEKKPKTLANFGKMHGESDHKCNCHCCNKPTYRPYKPGEVKCGDVFVYIDTGCELMVTGINPKGLVSLNGWNNRNGWKTPDELLAAYTKLDGSPAGILE